MGDDVESDWEKESVSDDEQDATTQAKAAAKAETELASDLFAGCPRPGGEKKPAKAVTVQGTDFASTKPITLFCESLDGAIESANLKEFPDQAQMYSDHVSFLIRVTEQKIKNQHLTSVIAAMTDIEKGYPEADPTERPMDEKLQQKLHNDDLVRQSDAMLAADLFAGCPKPDVALPVLAGGSAVKPTVAKVLVDFTSIEAIGKFQDALIRGFSTANDKQRPNQSELYMVFLNKVVKSMSPYLKRYHIVSLMKECKEILRSRTAAEEAKKKEKNTWARNKSTTKAQGTRMHGMSVADSLNYLTDEEDEEDDEEWD